MSTFALVVVVVVGALIVLPIIVSVASDQKAKEEVLRQQKAKETGLTKLMRESKRITDEYIYKAQHSGAIAVVAGYGQERREGHIQSSFERSALLYYGFGTCEEISPDETIFFKIKVISERDNIYSYEFVNGKYWDPRVPLNYQGVFKPVAVFSPGKLQLGQIYSLAISQCKLSGSVWKNGRTEFSYHGTTELAFIAQEHVNQKEWDHHYSRTLGYILIALYPADGRRD